MNKASAQDIAYDWLIRKIRQIPHSQSAYLIEVEVAEAAEVSRTPVREAMTRLQAEGLVQRTPRKGVFVPPISEAEISWIMDSRELVELHAFRSVLGDKATEDTMRSVLARQEAAPEQAEFIELDHAFHNAAVVAAGNPFQMHFYQSLQERQMRLGQEAVSSQNDRRLAVMEEHRAIVDAFAGGDFEALTVAVQEHLGRTLNTISPMHALMRRSAHN